MITNSRLGNKFVDQTYRKVQNLKGEISDEYRKKVKDAAKSFESLFMYLLIKQIRKAMLESFEKQESEMTFGGDILGDIGYMELSNQFSKSISGIGIANLIYKHLTGEDLKKVIIKPMNKVNNLQKINKEAKSEHLEHKDIYSVKRNFSKFGFDKLKEYEEFINEAANKNELSPELIKSVILVESNANPFAVSKAGAKGLMQLVDTTAKLVGVSNPFEPKQNILGGSRYLRQLLDTFDGNLEMALAAYNAGPGAVIKYNGIPPYAETRAYVSKVKRLFSRMNKE